MNVFYFLEERISFVRQFYRKAGEPFKETMRLIECGEEPFSPLYDEDGGFLYVGEYIQASESLDLLGIMCLTTLSSSFSAFLQALTNQIGLQCKKKKG